MNDSIFDSIYCVWGIFSTNIISFSKSLATLFPLTSCEALSYRHRCVAKTCSENAKFVTVYVEISCDYNLPIWNESDRVIVALSAKWVLINDLIAGLTFIKNSVLYSANRHSHSNNINLC